MAAWEGSGNLKETYFNGRGVLIDREKAFVGTMPVREAHKIDVVALQKYLQQNVEDYQGELVIEQFKGGQSNPTYRLSAGGKKYVMRRKPPGKLLKSAHAVDREYRVISALAGTDVAVPRTYCLCTDESVIGTWFYIMECVEGRVLWNLDLPGMNPQERASLYDSMNSVIAALHSVDYEKVGLGDFGRPGNYVSRQISRWSKQYYASKSEDNPAMDNLIKWLPENIPQADETTIVHGDYRLDNMVIHPTEPRVVAVLDWELSTLGDPLSDFAYHCMLWRLPPELFNGMLGLDLETLGIPTEEEYVAAYCRRTGREQIENWDFYQAFNLFRLSAILEGILGRVRDGTAANKEAANTADRAKPLAEFGWRLVQEKFG